MLLATVETLVNMVDSGVKPQEFLRTFPLPEPQSAALLTPCRTVELLDDFVTARGGNDLLVIDPSRRGS
nr:hypothetical protein [Deinococcus peraridilitoris]